MTRTSLQHYVFWLTITAGTVLSGCGGGTPGTQNEGSDQVTLSRSDLNLVSGHVAWGAPASWSTVCYQLALVDNCIGADLSGEFQIDDVVVDQALLQASYVDNSGQPAELYGLFYRQSGQTSLVGNLNPLTELIADAYLEDTGLTAAQCYADPSCSDNIQSGLDVTRLDAVIAGLTQVFGDLWPVDDLSNPINPITENYTAFPSEQPVNTDGLIEMTEWNIDNSGILTITQNNGTPIASLPLSQLAAGNDTDFMTNPAIVDPVDPTEANTVLLSVDFSNFTAPPAIVDVVITFNSLNNSFSLESPVFAAFTISATPSSGAVINSWTAELYGPDGSYQTWSYLDVPAGTAWQITMEAVGEWILIVNAADSNGNYGVGGKVIQIGRGLSTTVNATWGDGGSCVPNWSNFNTNKLNWCLESLDGGENDSPADCDASNESLVWQAGRCSLTNQFQAPANTTLTDDQILDYYDAAIFLGHCSSMLYELREYFYVNPLRNTGESFAEAQNRVRTACESATDWEWGTD